MSNHPSRKPNRLPRYDYTRNGAYFITICTKDRSPILWDVGVTPRRPQETTHFPCRGGSYPPANTDYLSSIGRLVESAILRISESYPGVFVDRYCIMPDHVHLILQILSSEVDGRIRSAPTVSTIVGQTKRLASKLAGQSIWQKSFHDHVIRNEQDYIDTMQYIDNNLLRQIHHIPKGM